MAPYMKNMKHKEEKLLSILLDGIKSKQKLELSLVNYSI